jgi:hypothetical protein
MALFNAARLLAFCSVVLFAAGCATTRPPVYSIDNSDVSEWYQEARELVQEHRGVDLQQVSLSTVNSREMLFVLSDLYGRKLDPNMTADMRVRVFADRAFAEVGYLQAVYDPFAKRVVVNEENLSRFVAGLTRSGIGEREAALTVLIHELVHAADDAEFDFVAVERQHAGDALGVYMIAEGHAELQTEELCKQAGCANAFTLARSAYRTPQRRLDNAEAIHAARGSNLLLLYGQSHEFLKALQSRDSDGSLVKQAMRTPPGSALDFFDAADFPNKQRADSRQRVYQVLSAIELEENGFPLLKVPASPYDDTVIPLHNPQRAAFVSTQRGLVNGAGKMVFINQHDRESAGVSVQLFETSGPVAVQHKWREFEVSHREFVAEINKAGIPARSISIDDDEVPTLPARAKIDAVQIENADTGKPFTLYSSLYISGNYLIAVSNADNLALNIEMMLEVIGQIDKVVVTAAAVNK